MAVSHGLAYDEVLVQEMRQLLDEHFIWNALHRSANRWTAKRFCGAARAVDYRLSAALDHPLFCEISLHQIDTRGGWSHGHNHESGFVSFVVAGELSSRSWYVRSSPEDGSKTAGLGQPPPVTEARHRAGDIIAFADTARYHSLMTTAPVHTVVLWTRTVRRPSQEQKHDGPYVLLERLPLPEVDRFLQLVQLEFFRIRTRMKHG